MLLTILIKRIIKLISQTLESLIEMIIIVPEYSSKVGTEHCKINNINLLNDRQTARTCKPRSYLTLMKQSSSGAHQSRTQPS